MAGRAWRPDRESGERRDPGRSERALRRPALESPRAAAWVDDDPRVRLGIDRKLYDVALAPLDEQADAAELARLRAAFAVKYALPPAPADAPPGSIPPTRYWRVKGHDG